MKNNNALFVRGASRRGAFAALALLLAVTTFTPAPVALAWQNEVTVPAGTVLQVRIETALNTSTAREGEEFRATVLTPVVVRGVEAIPRGTSVVGRVLAVNSNKAFGRPSGLTLRVDRVVSQTGASIDVLADLTDSDGAPLVTVDNLPRGSQLEVRINRAFVVDADFLGGGGGGGQGDDVIGTPATISQVQSLLRDLGYYTGPINGRMSPPTRAAIQLFQRDQRIPQTGFLDRTTLDRLGLIGESGGEVSLVNVISANAAIRAQNNLVIRIVTQGTTGWQLFEDHFRQRDALHVYVRGFRGGNARGTNELELTLRADEWQGINRIVVHGSGNDITIRSTDVRAGGLTVQEAQALEAEIGAMLQQYAGALGLRYNRFTGQIEFTRLNYRENETELLFALNALSSTSRLYTQLIRSSEDPQAIAGATDIFVLQSNAVDRAVSRTKSPRAQRVIAQWGTLRDDFARLEEQSNRNFRDLPGYR